MGDRLDLHNKLRLFSPNVYFQPPSNIQMKYPCIVYAKSDKYTRYGNDNRYLAMQGYRLTLIERDPDSKVADDIEAAFENCSITQYFTVDNLNHTVIELYY